MTDTKFDTIAPPPPPPHRAVPSLFEWVGGMPALEKLTARFYDKVRDDELLAPVFAQMSPEHPKHVAAFLAEVFRGPATYTAERGGMRRCCRATWVAG